MRYLTQKGIIVSKIKNTRFQIRIPLILSIGLAAGIFIGATVAQKDTNQEDLFTSLYKFREVMTYIDKAYVDPVDSEELVETAITKMLEKLDPHTVYIPKKEAELSNQELQGEFDGIGIEFNIFRDTIYVVAPLSGGPSEKVGLLSGDKIITVDGENVAGIGITNRGVIDRLRGKKGTKVKVGIKRGNQKELLQFTIVRDKIPQYSVDTGYMIDDQTGYIKVSRFSATTYDEFQEKLAMLKGKGMKKLVLDLQSNPGGYMDRAVNIADELLGGNVMIVSQDGKETRYNAEYSAYRDGMFEEGPVIVLINEGSASGSEIVAGALQDNDRALIVGRRSFGKGLVQSPIKLNDGSELRLTISRYYTPSGRCIQKPYDNGVEDYYKDLANRNMHGEFFNKDSIEINDSLEYTTTHGRTVYGGGGIMPDIFVPLDTSYSSMYFIKLRDSNAIREYVLNYYEKHQDRLEAMDFSDFKEDFAITQKMMDKIIEIGEREGVEFDEEGYQRSEGLIKTLVKAQIARSVWENDGFYPIINEYNEILQKALTLFDRAETLAENY